jgi:predicted metal-dependent peptidase
MFDTSIETKLAAARTRLILDKPFLGALALRLPMVAANAKWCPTSATDARKFYYNPEYIAALTLEETQFVLAHEALHCALSHFARRQHRIKHRWDVACDHAVNPLLVADGLKPPPGVLLLDAYEGMTAEEIYPCIGDNNSDQTMDQHLYDSEESEGGQDGEGDQEPQQSDGGGGGKEKKEDSGGGGGSEQQQQDEGQGGADKPEPLSAKERDELGRQWQQRMAAAAQQAMAAGKMGGVLARMVDHLLQPQLPWRMLLARYMTQVARDDYSYMRPSRREGQVIFPSLRSGQVDLVVALDTSGSVGEQELSQFLSEVNALKGQLRARVTLLACDTAVAEGAPWEFEPWEELRLPAHIKGGGGTSFVPVFEWLSRYGRQPDLLLYFTDAEGDFPRQEPNFPTLWLVKGRASVPWGQRIQLN